MGCICPPKDAITASIDRNLQDNENKDEKIIKLLFLGAGGSGKSTLFKQLRHLYGDGLLEDLRRGYTSNIYGNLIIGIKTLLAGNLDMADEGLVTPCEEKVASLINNISEEDMISSETAKIIKLAWADKGMQQTWKNRSELQLQDSLAYFVDNVDRISASDFVPDKDDVLHVRAVTTGIVAENMKIKDRIFHIVDVGGQRSERRKWISCFDNVAGLIFVVSLIAYNQVLYEDESTNRMEESLKLFKKTLVGENGRNFSDACVVLFLNKDDLFKKMIKDYPITKCFPDYNGELTEEGQYEYIRKKYEEQVAPRQFYVHRTCATDTDHIKVIFNLVNLNIIKQAFKQAGLLMAA